MDERLRVLADFVQQGSRVADIGADHGYLALELIAQGKAQYVIASDKNRGPYEAACRNVREAGMEQSIEVRLGDGLQILRHGEADTICIAGMGGKLICGILSAAPETLDGAQHLVLQPMNGAQELRRWLYGHGWHVEDEALAEEDGHIYEIISAKKGNEEMPPPALLLIGVKLWEKKPRLFKRHLEGLLAKMERALHGMERSQAAMESEKYKNLKREIEELEAYRTW